MLGEEILSSVNLISNDDINKISVANMLVYVFENWMNLLR